MTLTTSDTHPLDGNTRKRARPICRDEDPELFFPIGNTGPALSQIEEAKAVCRVCPLLEPCLEEALGSGAQGIWGGTSDDERRAMKRRAARTRARTAT